MQSDRGCWLTVTANRAESAAGLKPSRDGVSREQHIRGRPDPGTADPCGRYSEYRRTGHALVFRFRRAAQGHADTTQTDGRFGQRWRALAAASRLLLDRCQESQSHLVLIGPVSQFIEPHPSRLSTTLMILKFMADADRAWRLGTGCGVASTAHRPVGPGGPIQPAGGRVFLPDVGGALACLAVR